MDNDCYSRGDGILSTGMCKNQNLKRRQDAELIADGAPDAPRPYSQGMGIPGTSTSMNPEPKTYPEPKQNCEIEEIDSVHKNAAFYFDGQLQFSRGQYNEHQH